MTFREKLADWISGGALTTARLKLADAEMEASRLRQRGDDWQDNAAILALRCHKAHDALDAIAAEEKPTSNATVRRMARMAREALE